MTRKEMIDYLDQGIIGEESASSIYLRHLDAIMSRSGRPAPEIARMKDVITSLIADNKRHRTILTNIRQEVAKAVRDVY